MKPFDHLLWYERPAENFNEALPLGNGRIGAMAYGCAAEERLTLNEDTLWSGRPRQSRRHCVETWHATQALSRQGAFKQAQVLLENEFGDDLVQAYLPLGTLRLRTGHEAVQDYRRELNLQTACHTVAYTCRGVRFTRRCFISAADQALALRLTADQPGNVSFTLSLDGALRSEKNADENTLYLSGRCPDRKPPRGAFTKDVLEYFYSDDPSKQGVWYFAAVRAFPEGGKMTAAQDKLIIQEADAVTLLFAVRTNFCDPFTPPAHSGLNPEKACREDLRAAGQKGWDALWTAHVASHQALYRRCWIHLGETPLSARPTDERLRRHAAGEEDPSLYALLFHYGRYLLISASRPGTQPANLQGIWNENPLPPWSSNYTLNINTEMNYWPALAANLAECYEPLLRLIRELRQAGTPVARNYYGAPGFCSHHAADLWRTAHPSTNFLNNCCQWGQWPLSGGWLSVMAYEAWRYSGDEGLLREIAPLLRDSADFYVSLLEEKDGELILLPSTSPENGYILEGVFCPLDYTTTMTTAIIRDVLRCAAEALEALGEDASSYRAILPQLRPYQVCPDGTLNEWYGVHADWEIHHRHVSHLYGLFPSNQINETTKELMEACRKTLEKRGDKSTGWSLAWKINLWARLRDGGRAKRLLDLQLSPMESEREGMETGGGSYPNLFCAHPPFQIDGNFGACSGVIQMLLQQNAAGQTILLPALPEAWKDGEAHGLRLPGGKTISFRWENGRIQEASLRENTDV